MQRNRVASYELHGWINTGESMQMSENLQDSGWNIRCQRGRLLLWCPAYHLVDSEPLSDGEPPRTSPFSKASWQGNWSHPWMCLLCFFAESHAKPSSPPPPLNHLALETYLSSNEILFHTSISQTRAELILSSKLYGWEKTHGWEKRVGKQRLCCPEKQIWPSALGFDTNNEIINPTSRNILPEGDSLWMKCRAASHEAAGSFQSDSANDLLFYLPHRLKTDHSKLG